MNIIVKKNDILEKITADEILCISTTKQPHLLLVVTSKENYYIYDTLHNFVENDNPLTFCNKSMVVNLKKIKLIEESSYRIHLDAKEPLIITCSRRKFREILKIWKTL